MSIIGAAWRCAATCASALISLALFCAPPTRDWTCRGGQPRRQDLIVGRRPPDQSGKQGARGISGRRGLHLAAPAARAADRTRDKTRQSETKNNLRIVMRLADSARALI